MIDGYNFFSMRLCSIIEFMVFYSLMLIIWQFSLSFFTNYISSDSNLENSLNVQNSSKASEAAPLKLKKLFVTGMLKSLILGIYPSFVLCPSGCSYADFSTEKHMLITLSRASN